MKTSSTCTYYEHTYILDWCILSILVHFAGVLCNVQLFIIKLMIKPQKIDC